MCIYIYGSRYVWEDLPPRKVGEGMYECFVISCSTMLFIFSGIVGQK